MNKNTLVLAIIAIIIIGGAFLFLTGNRQSSTDSLDAVQEKTKTTNTKGDGETEAKTENMKEPRELTDYNYEFIPDQSTLRWDAAKVGGKHNGTVNIKSGRVRANEDVIEEARFVIDMKSIAVEDIQNPTQNQNLVDHLKSDDFFSVDEHPEAVLHITQANPVEDTSSGKPNYIMQGDLTIKDITNPIEFPATIVQNDDGTVDASAGFEIDRTLWDVRFGSGKFFEDIGDKAIDDMFTVTLNISFQPMD